MIVLIVGYGGEVLDSLRKKALPKGRLRYEDKTLMSIVILMLKQDASGHLVHFRARLVVRSNFEDNGTDYAALYTVMGNIALCRVLMSVLVSMIWKVEQVALKYAFLHAALLESELTWAKLPKLDG